MYVAAALMGAVCLFLGIVSRKEDVDLVNSRSRGLQLFFNRIAIYLYKRICIHRIPLASSVQVEKDLKKLHPEEKRDQLLTAYYVSKLAKTLMICVAGTMLGVVIHAQSEGAELLDTTGSIVRGTYEEGAKEVEVMCSLAEGEQRFTIEVGARQPDEEELNQLYESFCAALPDMIAGENHSLREVSQKLYLQEMYEGYPFAIRWESSVPEVIYSDGTVNCAEEVQEVELLATVSYGEWEWEETLSVQVIPLVLSEQEWAHRELEKLLLRSERDSRTEEEWKLPDSWEGQRLLWKEKTEDMSAVLWLGTIAVAFLVYWMSDKDLHDEVEKRRQQMKRNYPDVVHKMALYLGAGMTIRSTFQRLAEEYEQGKAAGKVESPVYEELLHTCRELKAGVSEGSAYERFGKRTGLQEYIRLMTLLTQNLKKGNSTLLQRLGEEASKASGERLQYGKRLGEEAVTKLLLPMVMMLMVVMLMIMLPAFSSVGV